MQTISIKNFFLFSISVLMLFTCGVGGFYIWKYEQEKALLEKMRQDAVAEQKAKRVKLDLFYLNEYKSFFVGWKDGEKYLKCLDVKTQNFWVQFSVQKIASIENHMRQDGYSWIEIETIKNRARQ